MDEKDGLDESYVDSTGDWTLYPQVTSLNWSRQIAAFCKDSEPFVCVMSLCSLVWESTSLCLKCMNDQMCAADTKPLLAAEWNHNRRLCPIQIPSPVKWLSLEKLEPLIAPTTGSVIIHWPLKDVKDRAVHDNVLHDSTEHLPLNEVWDCIPRIDIIPKPQPPVKICLDAIA